MTLLLCGTGESEAPTVRIEPRYLQVNAGDSVEFACIASGLPLPTLDWTRDGGELSPQASFEVTQKLNHFCNGISDLHCRVSKS